MTAKASCAFLALLLLVGTQIASSKSVVGTYEDEVSVAHALSKRATREDATTTLPPSTPNDKSPGESEPTTASPADDANTTVAPDADQTDDKEPATVKPLDEAKPEKEDTAEKSKETENKREKEKEKEKDRKQPQVVDRLRPEEEVPAVPAMPELPDASLVPPLPFSYAIPQPHHGFVPPPLDPGFAPYPWSFAPAPAAAPAFYEYPQPSGPAFSEGASAGAGSFAGATATASGTGGTVVTSTSPGGNGRPQVSSSSSSSGPGAAGPSPVVGSRGSFPADDDQSVGIEVDGPDAAPGKPQFHSGPGFASLNGPGYSAFAGGSFGNQFGPNPYASAYPMYTPYIDYGNYFQQYFAALQAQQMAFQRQIQAQIQAQQQAIWAQSNRIDSNFGFPTSSSSGPHTAYAGANIGPQGGSKTAYINPASPGIFSRFGDSIPPPSGNSYGVFTSSSSSTQTGPDGKPISHKVATVGVNDNGKVTYQTIHDP